MTGRTDPPDPRSPNLLTSHPPDLNDPGSDPGDPFARNRSLAPIPTLSEIPETKEEKQRRLLIKVALGVSAAILAMVAILVTLSVIQANTRAEAVERAGADGRLATIDDALELTADEDDPEDIALRARLMASRALEHRTGEAADAAKELGKLDPNEPTTMNALAASTYLALLGGDLRRAQQEASRIVVGGTWAAEAARARALTALALGSMKAAQAEATAAREKSGQAPRHVALDALVHGWMGKPEDGLQLLEKVASEDTPPSVQLAKARLLLQQRNAETARETVALLLTTGATKASAGEKAWAHLILARAASLRGDREAALREAAAARSTPLPGDPEYALALVEVLIDADAMPEAAAAYKDVLSQSPAGGPFPCRRAHAAAAVAIADRNWPAAERHLARCSQPSSRTKLISAQLADAQGKFVRAKGLYEQVLTSPETAVLASVRTIELGLKHSQEREAVALAAQTLQKFPSDPRLVAAAADAYLANDQPERAKALVQPALQASPQSAALLSAQGRIHLHNKRWRQALEVLVRATKHRPDHAGMWVDRGKAARKVGEIDQAEEAFNRALSINGHHRDALLGALELAVETADSKRGEALAKTVDELNLRSARFDRARARQWVLMGAGQRAFAGIRRALRRNPRDPVLFTALGDVFRHSEDYRAAINAYGNALRFDGELLSARLGRTIAQMRLGASETASEGLTAVREQAQTSDPGPVLAARIAAAQGRQAFLADRLGAARKEAERAIELDPRCSAGHLLQADLAAARREDALPYLRRVLAGREAYPEAMARIALASTDKGEVCPLARRYVRVAAGARHVERIRPIFRSCR